MSENNSNGFSSRADFLAPATRRYETVTLPVSKKRCRIQSLMEYEKEKYEADTLNNSGGFRPDRLVDARRRLIVLMVVDESGAVLLSEADMSSLRHLDGADMAHLHSECSRWAGFDKDDLESLVKNSDIVSDAGHS